MGNRRFVLGALASAAALAGCSALPSKPVRQTTYDFGPAPAMAGAASTTANASATPLVVPDLEVNGLLDSPALLYRLAYRDAFELLPYAYARWAAPPAQLVGQRLRDVLGRDRPVLDGSAGGSLARRGGVPPPVLRVELEEFSHRFDAPATSVGVIRLRCTLLENSAGGERLVGQRSFETQRPAPSADAAGGVRALTAATDAVAQDIAAWLRQR